MLVFEVLLKLPPKASVGIDPEELIAFHLQLVAQAQTYREN